MSLNVSLWLCLLTLTSGGLGEHGNNFKSRRIMPMRVRSSTNSTSADQNINDNRTEKFPSRIPLRAKLLYNADKCDELYELEDESAILIYSSPEPSKYKCTQNFTAKSNSSKLQFSCFSFMLRFNCRFESLEVLTENTSIKICGETKMPMISGDSITVKYSRHLFGLHGGYSCVIVAQGTSEDILSPSEMAFKECSDCGISEIQDRTRSVVLGKRDISIGVQTRIVGGETAEKKEYPWMAYLLIAIGNQEFACGGTLVSKALVVTAAHCLEGNIRNIQITLGLSDLNDKEKSDSEVMDSDDFTIHPDYDSYEVVNDLAVIKLPKQVQFSDTIRPLCLPAEDLNDLEGLSVIATGWGNTKFDGMPSSTLQTVTLKMWSNEICHKTWNVFGGVEILKTQLCALDDGKDTCNGDSGGPLITKMNGRWILVGVTSFGYECATPNIPGVYTRISKYSKWISDHIDEGDCD